MREITEFIFTYTPFDNTYPISFVTVHIIADTRKEAELKALDSWKFFNQDCVCQVTEGLKGYRKE